MIPSMKSSSHARRFGELTRPDAVCMGKYNIWRTGYFPKFYEMLRLQKGDTPPSPKIAPAAESDTPTSLQLRQIVRLSRKVTQQNPQMMCLVFYSTLIKSSVIYSTILDSLDSTLFFYSLLYSSLLFPSLLFSTLLFSILLYSTLLYSTLLYSTLCYSSLLYPPLLYPTLPYSTLLYSTLF